MRKAWMAMFLGLPSSYDSCYQWAKVEVLSEAEGYAMVRHESFFSPKVVRVDGLHAKKPKSPPTLSHTVDADDYRLRVWYD